MSTEESKKTELSRRAMLTRLGLAATAVYTAPVLLKLGEAHASGVSGRSGASGWSSGSRGSFSGRRDRRTDRGRRGGRSSFS